MSEPSSDSTGPKHTGGPWPKGVSGNPVGRPAGARNRISLTLERLMAADGADVVRAVVAAAKGGDMAAARMILDRLVPVRKGRAIALDLPEVVTVADVLQAQAAVVAAMAGGEVSPDEAAVVSGVLEGQRKALETVEFEERLRALEERVGTKP